MAQIIQFILNLFKRYVPEYRVVKETRAVHETADGQNLTLQTFYYPQVKKKKHGDWERFKILTLRQDYDATDLNYCHRYGRDEKEFDCEELAEAAIKCDAYKEVYRTKTIRMAMLTYWSHTHKQPEAVYYIDDDLKYSLYVHAYRTHDEVIEEINSMNPQIVNVETISK